MSSRAARRAGQILSDFYINSMSARGSTDQRIYFDGMGGGNMMLGGGTQAIAGGVNELGQAEMVYDVGSQSAESAISGVRMDAIPKDGGNTFTGTYRFFGSNSSAAEQQPERLAARRRHSRGEQARFQLGQQRRGRWSDPA